jgi:hypothetical protein
MTALADLLDPADRQRLAALAVPADTHQLAAAALDTARASDGTGQLAWLLVVVALAGSASPDEARASLSRMLEDGKLKTTALACLGALCHDDTAA